jgi:hypothetical protein
VNPSKLEQLSNLVPATPLMIAQWLTQIEHAGNDTLAIVLTCFTLNYCAESGVDLLDEIHAAFGVDGILPLLETLWNMGFEQQMVYEHELPISHAAYWMLLNLSENIQYFWEIKAELKEIDV